MDYAQRQQLILTTISELRNELKYIKLIQRMAMVDKKKMEITRGIRFLNKILILNQNGQLIIKSTVK